MSRKRLSFLWEQDGRWYAETPRGEMGCGPSRDSALARLREALHEERRARLQRNSAAAPVASVFSDRISRSSASPTAEDRDRAEIAEIDAIGPDDCLLVSPESFEALLDEQCSRRWRGPALGLGEDRAVIWISEHPISTALRQNRVLWITSGCYELEIPSHWVSWSDGLFAFDGSRLRPLHRKPENLKALIEAERPELDDADPIAWASFFAESIGRCWPEAHSLTTVEDLERLDAKPDYELDRRELARIAPLTPATIAANAAGWTLRFTTAFGESGMPQAIYAWQVTISRRYQVDIRLVLLSERIFHQVPFVME